MFEAFVMLMVGLVGGAASVMGTLPAVLVSLFGDTSALNTTPSGGDIAGPDLIPPLLPFTNQTFTSGGQDYQISLGSGGDIQVKPGSGSSSSTPPTTPATPPTTPTPPARRGPKTLFPPA
jgi:hypothetical protein